MRLPDACPNCAIDLHADDSLTVVGTDKWRCCSTAEPDGDLGPLGIGTALPDSELNEVRCARCDAPIWCGTEEIEP